MQTQEKISAMKTNYNGDDKIPPLTKTAPQINEDLVRDEDMKTAMSSIHHCSSQQLTALKEKKLYETQDFEKGLLIDNSVD